MPSSLLVPVATVTNVRPHPNADSLDICEVLGWQVVTGKGNLKDGDSVLYVPPDAVLPLELSDRFGVTKHLSKGRVRQVKLRGEPSFGFAVPFNEAFVQGDCPVLDNFADHFGITKYEPPVKLSMTDMAPENALFPKYTNIENMRNYPHLIKDGEQVAITEKIHGTNCRVGIVEGELMAGSHGVVRKPPSDPDGKPLDFADKVYEGNIYWSPFALASVRELLNGLATEHKQVILFGEVFGDRIQNLDYGHKGKLGFRAFDLFVDGNYLDYEDFKDTCDLYGVKTVPEVMVGVSFDLKVVKGLSSGKSAIADHMREGVVVRPMAERRDPMLGRVVLKYVSDEYLFGKHSDSKDV